MNSDLLREQKPDLQIASQVCPACAGHPALLCRTGGSPARWQKKERRTTKTEQVHPTGRVDPDGRNR